MSHYDPQLGKTRRALERLFAVTLGMVLLTTVWMAGTARPAAAATAGIWKVYAPGWNLVAGPGGSQLAPHGEPLFDLNEVAAQYAVVRGQPTRAGDGYWVYYETGAVLLLIGTPQDVTSVHVDAGHWATVGNSGTKPAVVRGADLAYVYDPQTGFANATNVQPGQAALVFADSDADVFMDPYSTYQAPFTPILARPSTGVTATPSLPSGSGAPDSATPPTEELNYLIVLGPILSDVDQRLGDFADNLDVADASRPADPVWRQLRDDSTGMADDLARLRAVAVPQRYIDTDIVLVGALTDLSDGMRDTVDGLLGNAPQKVTLGAGLLQSGARLLVNAEAGLPM